jgi:hypothetical protein
MAEKGLTKVEMAARMKTAAASSTGCLIRRLQSDFEDWLNRHPDLRRRYDLFSKVGSESERGMAVLVAAELDRILEVVLKSYDAAFTDERISSWLGAIPKREEPSWLGAIPESEAEPLEPKSNFTQRSVELITALEADAVHAANGRVYEESFSTAYRRGCDPDAPPFNSAAEAATAYKAERS